MSERVFALCISSITEPIEVLLGFSYSCQLPILACVLLNVFIFFAIVSLPYQSLVAYDVRNEV